MTDTDVDLSASDLENLGEVVARFLVEFEPTDLGLIFRHSDGAFGYCAGLDSPPDCLGVVDRYELDYLWALHPELFGLDDPENRRQMAVHVWAQRWLS